jgi:hypothetical protein
VTEAAADAVVAQVVLALRTTAQVATTASAALAPLRGSDRLSLTEKVNANPFLDPVLGAPKLTRPKGEAPPPTRTRVGVSKCTFASGRGSEIVCNQNDLLVNEPDIEPNRLHVLHLQLICLPMIT